MNIRFKMSRSTAIGRLRSFTRTVAAAAVVLVAAACDGDTTESDTDTEPEVVYFCGDGVVSDDEVCDDNNTVSGDGCASDCSSDESCGNGVIDVSVGEACDDENGIDGDGCQANCALPTCGDGVVDANEICDDENTIGGDGCGATCMSDETCGNGVVDSAAGEACDDGNTDANDGCGVTCNAEFCGNGVVEFGEACDDGNSDPGDNCFECQTEWGHHLSETMVIQGTAGLLCNGSGDLNWRNHGLKTFDECQVIANNTGTQYYSGTSTAEGNVVGWIGAGSDGKNATVAGSSWPTEELRAADSLLPCVTGDLISTTRPKPTAKAVEELYTDADGRVWHYWDVQKQTLDQALWFAAERGARIVNPASVGMKGAVRGTATTHWCFAAAQYNSTDNCNTSTSCDWVVGYWE